MTPTNNLRFVKRYIRMEGDVANYYGSVSREIHILQQQFVSEDKFDVITGKLYAEWRDVPTEDL